MARSLRNSKSLAAKAHKRKGFFTDVVKAREARLAEKLRQNLEAQKDQNKPEKIEEDNKKISTSGWRASRHVTYKKNKLKKNKRRAALVFKK